MAVIYVSNKGSDGTSLGQDSTDLISFYGATPIAKWAFTLTATTAIATTVFSAAATGIFGFQTSTAATALVTRVRQLQVDMETLVGLMETAGLVTVTGN
jgi:hypothetical protein